MKKIILSLLLFSALVNAADIDQTIEQIQLAEGTEKVQLMNEFKQELMSMNMEEREAAIEKLKLTMQMTNSQISSQEKIQNRIQMSSRIESQSEIQTQMQAQMQARAQYMNPVNVSTPSTNTMSSSGF